MGYINPEHLKSSEWESFRQRVVTEHGGFCSHCYQRTADPFVQPLPLHFVPGREPWEYEVDEMQVVCRDCYYDADKRGSNFLRFVGQFTSVKQSVMKKSQVVPLLVIGCILSWSAIAQTQSAPHYISYTLAGYDLRKITPKDHHTALYDSKRGYYLVMDVPPRGTGKHLFLIRPTELKDEPEAPLSKLKIKRVTLPSLVTERGVKIGDSPQSVLSKLGLPTSHDSESDGEPERTGTGTYHYSYPGARLKGYSYEAWYDFKKGHLQTISIAIEKGLEVSG